MNLLKWKTYKNKYKKERIQPCFEELTDDILNDQDLQFNETTLAAIDEYYSMLRSIDESKNNVFIG